MRYTHAAPLRILGHPPLSLPETPLDVGNGDVLLCADLNGSLTAAEFLELRRLRLIGMRIVLVIYDLLPMRHPELFPELLSSLVTEWYSRMLGIADAVACISRAVADDLAAWLDENPDVRATPLPIGAFHLGADFPLQTAEAATAPDVAAALAAARQRPMVVMTSTVEPRKGYQQAFAAFENLWREGVEIGLTIIGKQGWKMESFAERLRSAPQMGDRVHWLTGCTDSEMRQLYEAGSGLLMASNHEGFGLPIIEAAQAGLAVMARDLPVFREVAGEHARYFSGDSPQALAQALQVWMAEGFTPSPTGMNPLSWDDSFSQLNAIIFDDHWHLIWHPSSTRHV
jgi:glycosyltransferase involved in cell wall biosynthesis